MTFKDLRISDPILKALQDQGYTQPTEIQQRAIPILLQGRDLLGCAQTGTGKTAAFAVPIIQSLDARQERHQGRRHVRALVVAPTRELAIQINDSFTAYSKYTALRNAVIFGGVKQGAQVRTLQRGVDVLIATPGRLLDLIGQGHLTLKHIEYVVLDEADHMLDMGFIHDIKKIIRQLPDQRQSMFFSATMPGEILDLSRSLLGNPEKVTVRPQQATADKVDQSVYFVSKKEKQSLLEHILDEEEFESALIFSRTKHGANKIVRKLEKQGVSALAIHGNKSQGARQKALQQFKDGTTKVLVATDIAARGIDVSALSLVINYDLPQVPETYVHRIGRTGRAKMSGVALSFCDDQEFDALRDIQKLLKQSIPVIDGHPFVGNDQQEFQQSTQTNRQAGTGNSQDRSGARKPRNKRRNNRNKPRHQNRSRQQA